MTNLSENLYGRRPNPLVMVPLALMLVLLIAATGYYQFGAANGQPWSFFDCFYMAVITLTTVGYGEVLPGFADTPGARGFNCLVMLFGYAVVAWAISTIIATAVEGRLGERLLRRRMMHQIEKMSGHYIVCGAGDTGEHVVDELLATQRGVVVIETDPERLNLVCANGRCPFVAGDAEDDAVLREAGIERAAGLVACLPADKDNLYVVLSARTINPGLRVVARAIHDDSPDKLARAGADAVVAPSRIGGLRMASELVRPRVTGFLDRMLRDRDRTIRVEEVTLPFESPVAGKTLEEADLHRRTGLLVIATQVMGEEQFVYNPTGSHVLRGGMVLIVLGVMERIGRLKELVGA
jgi:voltage-gated potassium channel